MQDRRSRHDGAGKPDQEIHINTARKAYGARGRLNIGPWSNALRRAAKSLSGALLSGSREPSVVVIRRICKSFVDRKIYGAVSLRWESVAVLSEE